jgi:hypothetical protein
MKRWFPAHSRNCALVTAGLCAHLILFPRLSAAGLEVQGSGGVAINGEQVAKEKIWQEYHFQNSARSMIHGRDAEVVDEKLLRAVIRQVTRKELLLQEARRLGYALTPEDRVTVRQRLVEQWKGEANFRTALPMLGTTEEFLLDRAGKTLVIKRMATGESKAKEGITGNELREHYRQYPARYMPEKLPPLRYIFVPAEEAPARSTYTTIAREGASLSAGGESFASMVRRYSKHESAARGGVVPEREAGEVGLPHQPAKGKLKPCRISPFLADSTGLSVYLRDCRVPIPFAEVREKVRADLIGTRRTQYLQDLGSRLEGQSDIRYMTLSGDIPSPAGSDGKHGH